MAVREKSGKTSAPFSVRHDILVLACLDSGVCCDGLSALAVLLSWVVDLRHPDIWT